MKPIHVHRCYRSGALLACTTSLFLTLNTQALAAAPTQPGSLRYEVYSNTAAEFFWERSSSDDELLGYEVCMPGVVCTTINALSYFTDFLKPGNNYTFSVLAIDREGVRSPISSVSFIAGDRSSAISNTPKAPENLRGTVYSKTAAEIMWDRASAPGLRYEVFRNAGLVEITDGISFFDGNLVPAGIFEYSVRAIDDQGNRSTSTSITVSTSGGSTAPVTSDLAAPTRLRGTVYSSTAAEIMWDRPAVAGLRYEIQRDSETADITDGISYYDDSLSAGNNYTFTVVAMDSQGNRSPAASVMLNTTGTVATTPESNIHLSEPYDLYQRDGYSIVDVIRVDIKTATVEGICSPDDQSGCTLADVMADTDGSDDFTVDIPVHFQSDDFADDGSVANAGLRQRGGFSRLAPQKSFRIKLDSKKELWRNERRIQLNKMPYDNSRIRNKLAFDLMSEIPNLPSLRTQFVNLWIDDGRGPVDYGLFTHTEYVGKEYLVNRERNEDDNLYKAEKFLFAPQDLPYLQVDEAGEPMDLDQFEIRLEIKRGDDHRKLIEMITALNDGAQTFESVMDRYFDDDNVLTWVTVNALIHQVDAVTHNFYLYNPAGSEKFYFLPWDYDGTFSVEQEPMNNLETDELLRRLYYGYSKSRASNFLNLYYRQEGIHQRILTKAEELRNSQLMDSQIRQKTDQFASVTSPYISQQPDSENNASYNPNESQQFAGYVAQSHAALINYHIPLPPKLRGARLDSTSVFFSWTTAHTLDNSTVTYDLEVSTTPGFELGTTMHKATGLEESASGEYAVYLSNLSSGKHYARLIARVANGVDNAWQIASNRPTIAGEMRVGVLEFTVP